MKKFIIFSVFVMLMTLISGCSGGASETQSNVPVNQENKNEVTAKTETKTDEKYTLKVSSPLASGTQPLKFLEWFNEEVQKRSDGRLSLEIFPNAQLMPPTQEMPALLDGTIDMALNSSAYVFSFEPAWYVFDLPFLWDIDPKDPSVYIANKRAFLDDPNGGGKIGSLMEDKGVKLLAHIGDYHSAIAVSKANNMITDLNSIKKMKIRIPGGNIVPKTLEAVGANGTSVQAAEVVPALQQGLIDGALSTPAYFSTVQWPLEAITLLPLSHPYNIIFISKEKFETLPADLQQILVETGKDLEKYSDETTAQIISGVVADFEKKGMEVYVPTADELNEWKDAVMPVWDEFAKMVNDGQQLIDAAVQ